MKLSTIGWTDYSGGPLNFVSGCTPVSEGCSNCYARATYKRFGLDFTPHFDRDKLAQLMTIRFPQFSPKRGAPHKPMAFPCDTGDLFHESIPDGDLWDALDVLAACWDVNWQVLTKRAERMNGVVDEWLCRKGAKRLPGNIWLGVTTENQARADERIPALLATPAATRFVSVEPCLGAMDLSRWIEGLRWMIVGGESGPHRRPFDVAWALDLYKQCREANVPFFYKQGGALRPGQDDDLPVIGKVKEWPL